MARNLRQRLEALEAATAAAPRRPAAEMSDAELEAFLAPHFGGCVPTDEELTEFLTRAAADGDNAH